MAKDFQLLSTEPLTDFEESVLRMLRDLGGMEYMPRAMVSVILTDSEEVLTFYHRAGMQDMLLAKGYIELDIINDNILGNLPYYVEQAEKEGLVGEYEEYEEEEECEDE